MIQDTQTSGEMLISGIKLTDAPAVTLLPGGQPTMNKPRQCVVNLGDVYGPVMLQQLFPEVLTLRLEAIRVAGLQLVTSESLSR